MWQPLLLVALLARLAEPQAPDTTHRPSGAIVSGVVHDSVSRAPLAGATVQLVAADPQARSARIAVSDSLGRFVLGDVPDGRYRIAFFHPVLESLGLEPPLRELLVSEHLPVRADLAIPSPERLRTAVCGPPSPESGAVVVGVVRDALNRLPAPGVRVTAEWLELSFGLRGPVRHIQRLVATTAENGWFAMCNVPSAGTMFLIASRGADSTDLIEVQVQGEGLLRRELYIAPVRSAVAADTTSPSDTRAAGGRVSGSVVTAADGRPRVAGAAPVNVARSTLEAVLDTVKVTARKERSTGFQERHRSADGRYITAEDIARRNPVVASELFRLMPGIHLQHDLNGVDVRIRMPGAFGLCAPTIYLNGLSLGDRLTTNEFDTWVRPSDITGIEIYSEAATPAEYRQGMIGRTDAVACGILLIWTKEAR